MRATLLVLSLLFSTWAHAQINPARKVEELRNAHPEWAVRVKTARVVLADYVLIRKDFPPTRKMSEEQIDQWILDNAAYVSKVQAAQTRANSEIQIAHNASGKPIERTVYRPERYGRAFVLRLKGGYLLDGKGMGSDYYPNLGAYKTGLASLGEVIREFLFQKKIQQVLDHSGSGYNTVGSYAVIDWGFDVIGDDGKPMRAGAILREAHRRPETISGNHFMSMLDSKIVEWTLRHYGITSTGDDNFHKFKEGDGVNIQSSENLELIDFGAYLVKRIFQRKAFHYAPIYADVPLLDPESGDFPQPDSRMALPYEMWGSSESGRENPKYDNPYIWGHRVASELKSGKISREGVQKHYRDLMDAGALPQELAGTFKEVRSKKFRLKMLTEIIKAQASKSITLNSDTFTEWCNLGGPQADPSLIPLFLEDFAGAPRYLTYNQVLALNQLLSFKQYSHTVALVLFSQRVDSTVLLELFHSGDPSQIQIISGFMDHLENVHQVFKFLDTEGVQKSSLWREWALKAVQTSDAAFQICYRIQKSGEYPELFKAYLSTRPDYLSVGKVLEQPHWANHPEFVNLGIDYIFKNAPKNDRASIKETVDNILQASHWKNHSNRSQWIIQKASCAISLAGLSNK